MPTDSATPAALFLFAHQDDEFGVFHTIEACLAQGRRVACAYLTRGVGPLAAQRNAESVAVLTGLGVASADIYFAGDELAIDDASLPTHAAAAGAWIAGWLAAYRHIALICVTAWEGGHHDHDMLHVLAARAAADADLLERLWQYSLYNAHGMSGPFFKVLAPLPANGAISASRIAWSDRWRYLRLCTCYPSQRRTWIGLLPFVFLHYLLRGTQGLQPVRLARFRERPHAGRLYYEGREFFTYEAMAELVGSAGEQRAVMAR